MGKEKEIILLKDELRTKEESLKDIEAQGVDLIKVKYELDLKKETIKKNQQSLKAKEENIAVLKDELKAKEKALQVNETQTVELTRMNYEMKKNKEKIRTLQQSV